MGFFILNFILLLLDALLTFLMPGFEKTVHSCFKDRVKLRFLRTNSTYYFHKI